MSQLNKYYNDVEKTFKDKFKMDQNKLYFIPKRTLNSHSCKQIGITFTKAVKDGEFLGRGSFGCVSLCKVEGIPGYCVMKTVMNFIYDDLKNEIETLELTFKCQYTTKMLYAGFKFLSEMDSSYVLVLECISGGDLFHHANNSNLKLDAMKVIFYQISKAIDFLHRHHRTHGDLKLNNVGLTEKGNVKLFDFGKSRNVSKPCILPRGTLIYDAPEVINQIEADDSIDWWSYGVLVAAMLQDDYPFNHEDEIPLESMITDDEPTLTIDDPDAKDFVMKLLHKDPKKRLKTPWKHKFLKKVNSNVPLFIPGDVVSKLVNEKPSAKKEEKYAYLGVSYFGEKMVLNDLLLRYPTRECLKLMMRKK